MYEKYFQRADGERGHIQRVMVAGHHLERWLRTQRSEETVLGCRKVFNVPSSCWARGKEVDFSSAAGLSHGQSHPLDYCAP